MKVIDISAVGVVVLVAVLCCFEGAQGWGKEGHMAIAQLANNRLTDVASAVIQKYLGGKTLEQIAPLPDDYDHSSAGKWSAPLHYVNLPRSATAYNDKYCIDPPGCVVSAIKQFYGALAQENTTGPACQYGRSTEPCPIEFLVHFVGDVHQPLHVSYANDKGGNAVHVTWYGKKTNLHSVWDADIIASYDSNVNTLISDTQSLMESEPDLMQEYSAVTSPALWANESYGYVLTSVYNYDSPALGDSYYNASLPIVQQRLIAAAVRLADLFNNLFQ